MLSARPTPDTHIQSNSCCWLKLTVIGPPFFSHFERFAACTAFYDYENDPPEWIHAFLVYPTFNTTACGESRLFPSPPPLFADSNRLSNGKLKNPSCAEGWHGLELYRFPPPLPLFFTTICRHRLDPLFRHLYFMKACTRLAKGSFYPIKAFTSSLPHGEQILALPFLSSLSAESFTMSGVCT